MPKETENFKLVQEAQRKIPVGYVGVSDDVKKLGLHRIDAIISRGKSY